MVVVAKKRLDTVFLAEVIPLGVRVLDGVRRANVETTTRVQKLAVGALGASVYLSSTSTTVSNTTGPASSFRNNVVLGSLADRPGATSAIPARTLVLSVTRTNSAAWIARQTRVAKLE